VLYAGRGEGAALIDQADAGIVVPPEDGAALAAAARYLAADAALARTMGTNARAFVEREYAWGDLVARWLGDLEGALPRSLAT
jgi:glycosyltransferase involved in cell wall biosynthesis